MHFIGINLQIVMYVSPLCPTDRVHSIELPPFFLWTNILSYFTIYNIFSLIELCFENSK